MTHQFARVAREGRVTLITIDRPESANALHPEASWEMASVFDEFAADPDQWVAILTGAGERAFSAGMDLKYRAQFGRQPLPASGFGGMTKRFDLDKPVIAAINGAAMGGGFELALACDLIVASERARFGLPEVKRGLVAFGGGLHRLPRQVGLRIAMELALTGREMDAQEALSLHIVNAVVPQAELMAEARRWVDILLSAGPLAIRASKQAMMRGLDEPGVAAALARQDDYPAVQVARASADAREGALAFAEKRQPRWEGR
jgi:acetyl-CoA C-acetyltransferase